MPLVFRSVVGAGGRFGAIHSQMPASWFMGVPGLKIVAPSTPGGREGAAARRRSATTTRCSFFEHKRLYALEGEVDGDGRDARRGGGRARGSDVTLVTAMKGVHDALEAAERLERDGVSVEVIDLRTLRPIDVDTVLASVRKTNRIVVVEEGPLTGGWAGEVLACVTEQALGHLDDAWRIATPNTPIPYSPPLEDAFLPGPDRIVARDSAAATVEHVAATERSFESVEGRQPSARRSESGAGSACASWRGASASRRASSRRSSSTASTRP